MPYINNLKIIDRETTLSLIDFPGLIKSAEEAFIAQSNGTATPPAYINMKIYESFAHFKAGYKYGDKYFAMKFSGGFWSNAKIGLPVDFGYIIVHDAKTGQPIIMFLDGGAITDYRTAAAGAVAAKYASRENSQIAGVIGTGVQAHLQIEALTFVRNQIKEVRVWGRNSENVRQYIIDQKQKLPKLEFTACDEIKDAVEDVDILITATPSREALVKAEWIKPGTHITAVGAAAPYMQEHEPKVVGKADFIYVDSIEKCIVDGEIHHALEKKLITRDQITGELGQLIEGKISGRKKPEDITFVDLVGLGIQDATAASYLLSKYDTNLKQ